ncbi:MAG TPA: guanitoxin biosynthesis heme-dependent pre-guanitoxin N-hydroxylase GntA [Hyphomonadaceae bacterium]|nr:guanitoxin biosynthesis heme-dependent pre-guanitoxin N-hydroxylase GntA [Hyphomonadaceae bacterium]
MPADFEAFIHSDAFPCVGAKSAHALGGLHVHEAGDFASSEHDAAIHEAIVAFGDACRRYPARLSSFACLFRHGAKLTEAEFEAALWRRVQGLHDVDAQSGAAWAENVAREPESPDFSFSVGGMAYFVVGLHPGASRAARRFCRPALIFNPHEQFERLRADGRYYQMQSIVREREIARNGSINPMLSDFGRGREAAQYSGREVGPSWTCPLKVRT